MGSELIFLAEDETHPGRWRKMGSGRKMGSELIFLAEDEKHPRVRPEK
jgi:hypothetical protein